MTAQRTHSGVLFTFRMIPVIAAELARRSIDPQALLTEAGLPADALRGEITAPLARIQSFVDLAGTAFGSETFGLDLAERIPAGAYGVAEFLVRSAATVDDALRVITDFATLVNPVLRFHFSVEADAGELHFSVAAQRDTLGCNLNEYTIAYLIKQFSTVLGAPVPLARVWFSHGRKRAADAVAQRFGTHVRFQATDCGFAVARDVLARPMPTADAALHEFLLGQARAQLGRVGPVDIVTQVARVIEVRLPAGDVGAADVATAMATTVRSLQRHLADAGTAYRDVLAHVRTRRREELRQGGVAEPEIARQLGFADARSMRRSLDERAED
ncbi:MAG: AraC family transcriptional regulator ligand-binding domain-containing protein [Deltaproteobacteria bacterium]|nr:AraC family transcriptional regulator ligand-binding domain-containing protein [Deltaproteobacteria bacterium]